MSLGENIYKYRTAKRMSQGDLADALDVSRQSVSKWENNGAVPELDKLMKMSKLFGVTLDELVNGQPTDKHPEESSPAPPIIIESGNALSSQKIIGIIILCFGLVLALMMFWRTGLGAFLPSILMGAPFVICGMICLKSKRFTGLYCTLTMYLFLWLPMGILTQNYIRNDIARAIQGIHILWGLALIFWGFLLHRQGRFFEKKSTLAAFFTVLALSMLISYLFLRFPGLLPSPRLLSF